MNINQISSTFDNHINIKKVKEYFPDASSNNFEFTEVSQDEVKKEVLHLNVKKSSTSSSIPATILKQSEIYLPFLTNSINYRMANFQISCISFHSLLKTTHSYSATHYFSSLQFTASKTPLNTLNISRMQQNVSNTQTIKTFTFPIVTLTT